jgi:6-phosphofructokinase 1
MPKFGETRMIFKVKNHVRRVGIMTGGGDCPGLNAVIRAVAKTLISEAGAEIIGIKDGFHGLVTGNSKKLDYMDVSGILTRGGTILGSSNKDNPFDFYLQQGDSVVRKDCSDMAMANYKKWGLDALVCLGGDGTMSVANRLIKMGMNIVGVPKTIDNDLPQTDRTFGFDTAVMIVTEAIDRLHTTAASHHRCLVVETMGRYAGWIALHAGVAGGADIILIPEIPFDPVKVCETVKNRYSYGKRFTIIAVAEGAKPKGGQAVVERQVKDSPEPIRLGGISKVVADLVEKETGVESRHIILGHVQRGGTPTAFDRILATRYGGHAAQLVINGQFGRIPVLKGNDITDVAIAEIADKPRNVPPDDPMIKAAIGVGTSFGV